MLRPLILALALLTAAPALAQDNDPWEKAKVKTVIAVISTQATLYAREHADAAEPIRELELGARSALTGILDLLAQRKAIFTYRVDVVRLSPEAFETRIWFTLAADLDGTSVTATFTFKKPAAEKLADA